ncbi:MAG: hypothetical protein ABMA01_13505 [Chthoniobacteraceae bacterium]
MENTTATTTTTTEILDILAKAQAATMEEVNRKRIELLDTLKKAEQVHATDDYKVGVVAVLNSRPNGMHLRNLTQVFSEIPKLRAAIKGETPSTSRPRT